MTTATKTYQISYLSQEREYRYVHAEGVSLLDALDKVDDIVNNPHVEVMCIELCAFSEVLDDLEFTETPAA